MESVQRVSFKTLVDLVVFQEAIPELTPTSKGAGRGFHSLIAGAAEGCVLRACAGLGACGSGSVLRRCGAYRILTLSTVVLVNDEEKITRVIIP